MMLRSTQAPRPSVHRFSSLTSPRNAVRIANRAPTLEREASELRTKSGLFLVPKNGKPVSRRWKSRMVDGLFVTVALAAMIALCCTLQ